MRNTILLTTTMLALTACATPPQTTPGPEVRSVRVEIDGAEPLILAPVVSEPVGAAPEAAPAPTKPAAPATVLAAVPAPPPVIEPGEPLTLAAFAGHVT